MIMESQRSGRPRPGTGFFGAAGDLTPRVPARPDPDQHHGPPLALEGQRNDLDFARGIRLLDFTTGPRYQEQGPGQMAGAFFSHAVAVPADAAEASLITGAAWILVQGQRAGPAESTRMPASPRKRLSLPLVQTISNRSLARVNAT